MNSRASSSYDRVCSETMCTSRAVSHIDPSPPMSLQRTGRLGAALRVQCRRSMSLDRAKSACDSTASAIGCRVTSSVRHGSTSRRKEGMDTYQTIVTKARHARVPGQAGAGGDDAAHRAGGADGGQLEKHAAVPVHRDRRPAGQGGVREVRRLLARGFRRRRSSSPSPSSAARGRSSMRAARPRT